eukprot:7844308-Pyramimonas_sp.AAC.2
MEVIDHGTAEGSDLQGNHHDFIYEIYVAWPECMLSVLPRMTDELQVCISRQSQFGCAVALMHHVDRTI